MEFSQKLLTIFLLLIIISLNSCSNSSSDSKKKQKKEPVRFPNTLFDNEVAAGWELLFDGKTTRKWRGYNQEEFPKDGWYIDVEKNLVGESGGSIITKNKFVNFDLKLEFKLSKETNSGIFYKVKEIQDTAIWMSGIEYELVHPETIAKAGDLPIKKHSTGDVYDLLSNDMNSKIYSNSWNHARIIVLNDYVEHWLNNELYLEYKKGSESWDSIVIESKFRNSPIFGETNYGHIGLQQDMGVVKFRNIKIKEL